MAKPTVQTVQNLPPIDRNQRYSIPEACAYLRCSDVTLLRKLKAEIIKPIREGHRTYVPGSEIIRVSTLPEEGVR